MKNQKKKKMFSDVDWHSGIYKPMKIPKELKHYADWVFIKTGIPQEETIKRVIEGCKIS